MDCRVCAKTVEPLFEVEGYNFLRCSSCGHVQRKEGYDSTLYSEDEHYFDQYDNENNYFDVYRQILTDCTELTKTTRENRGKMLDVGSSTGMMLRVATEYGWDSYGIEISPTAVEASKKRGCPNVYVGSLESADYPEGCFSLVTINHLLEHMENPIPVLERLGKWVAPDGLLCIGVPNFACSASRRDGKRWNGLVPNEHIQQFTPNSLRKAVETATGFDIAQFSGNHAYGKSSAGLKEFFNTLVAKAKDRLLLGRDMLLIARRPHG